MAVACAVQVLLVELCVYHGLFVCLFHVSFEIYAVFVYHMVSFVQYFMLGLKSMGTVRHLVCLCGRSLVLEIIVVTFEVKNQQQLVK